MSELLHILAKDLANGLHRLCVLGLIQHQRGYHLLQ
jgi:hypothetical protein